MNLFDDEPEGSLDSGCPTLAAFLFLRLGWETSNFDWICSRGACNESL
jgi:hypothetical protein